MMQERGWLKVVAIILTISGSGCSVRERLITVPLPLPPRPVLPALSAEDLECISDDAFERLMTRDLGRKYYAEQLEEIIMSTHERR